MFVVACVVHRVLSVLQRYIAQEEVALLLNINGVLDIRDDRLNLTVSSIGQDSHMVPATVRSKFKMAHVLKDADDLLSFVVNVAVRSMVPCHEELLRVDDSGEFE